jgi:hypothetical protein
MRPQRREIAACVASKPPLSDVSLCLTERKPFGVLAEGLLSNDGRGDWPNFEPRPAAVRSFVTAFSGLSQPYVLTAARLGRRPMSLAAHDLAGHNHGLEIHG